MTKIANTPPKGTAMTDTTTPATEPADTTTPESAGDTTPAAEAAGNTGEQRDVVKYRRRLREAEAERDMLAAQLDATRRATIDHLVQADCRIEPAGFWASGAELGDLLDEDGTVDTGKVKAAADTAAKVLGLERRGSHMYVPSEGNVAQSPRNGWQDAFKA